MSWAIVRYICTHGGGYSEFQHAQFTRNPNSENSEAATISRQDNNMKARTALQLRKAHRYIGLFFTPTILFFSLSGALQTLGLHENHGAGPPAATWIRWMASIHKDQRLMPAASGEPSPEPPQDEHHADKSAPKHRKGPSSVPLKAFVVLFSLGIAVTSLLGMIIALTNRTLRTPSAIAIALGILFPVILLLV